MLENHEGWLPARAALHPTGLYLALRDIAAAELQDPFMQETVLRVAAPEAYVQVARGDLGKADPRTAPAGLVFHVARCGSTLVSQLLKQHGAAVVYAEPLPVNEILLPPQAWPRSELVAALRSLGDAFARHARAPYVLKLSSWNTFYCDIVADAFPATPWVLCVRDPVEVGVSLLDQPPGWLRDAAGAESPFAPLVDPGGKARSPEERIAGLYGAFCDAASRLDPARGKIVHYDVLPAAVWEVVAPHFGLPVDAPRRQRMTDAARRDAKAPVGAVTPHASDVARKQSAATTALRHAMDASARPRLARLAQVFDAVTRPPGPGDTST